MKTNGNAIAVYAVYIVVAVGLTAWLARTLFRHGTAFLHDVFADKPELADAVNRLLVVGFYMPTSATPCTSFGHREDSMRSRRSSSS